ncbi:MAG TPA: hypothetical protein ENK31_05100 [Nannocystis exedens]|nr:hypothetical protein [Nannocystis exedens]
MHLFPQCCQASLSGLGLAACIGLVPACGPSGSGSEPEPDPCDGPTRCIAEGELPLPRLSDYDFFQGELADFVAKEGVVPYSLASPLWSDQAGKGRYVVLPEDKAITFDERDGWLFPEGTIIIKTFFFDHDRRDPSAGSRIIETRLLIRQDHAWTPITYRWNDDETDAELLKVGARVDVEFIDEMGTAQVEEYIIPNTDQCGNCHEIDDTFEVLGPITPQLNIDINVDGTIVNQLRWFAEKGLFDSEIPDPAGLDSFAPPMDTSRELDARARAYLHANCSHCHRDGGGASKSGLVFLAWEQEPAKLGICKLPVAAGPGTGGYGHDIVPGSPDQSIIVFRMDSLDPDIKMPELPNRVIDSAGVNLIREWIAAMPAKTCGDP